MGDRSTWTERKRAVDVSRRGCLKAMSAALLAGSAWAAASDLKAPAKQQIRLGIDGRLYAKMPVAEAARRIRADGFTCIMTDFRFADAAFDPLAPDWSVAQKISDTLSRQGIRVSASMGYYNVVDPDPVKRRRGEERMHALIANWKRLGECPNISTETGTFNRQSEWAEDPENFTEEGYQKCRAAVASLVAAAEKAGAVVSLEAYWQNVICSITRAERLLREIDSPALRLVMDPCNYYRPEDLPKMQPMLEEMFRRLGDQIVVAHAKDVKASPQGTDLPAAGLGVLDYPLYLRLLARLDRPIDLILEHLQAEDIPRARDFVLAQMEKV